jgi:hypothetical protein
MGNKAPPDRGITLMITVMGLREFFTRMAPAAMELIARDCGVADADDRVDALVAYSQNYGLGVVHWHVRYPELAQDRGLPPTPMQQLAAVQSRTS